MDGHAINFGASPPGPQNIFGARMENSSDSSSPRRFGPSDDVSDSPGSELLQPTHRSFPSHVSHFDDVFDNGLEEVIDYNAENDMEHHFDSLSLHEGGKAHSHSAPPPEPLFAQPASTSSLSRDPSNSSIAPAQSGSGISPASSSHNLSSSPNTGAPGAFKLGPVTSSPTKASKGTLSQQQSHQMPSSSIPSSSAPASLPSQSQPAASQPASVPPPHIPRDSHTEKLYWLFSSIKAYRNSTEFNRPVNFLGKTADLVESGARSLKGLFGFGSGSSSNTPNSGDSPVLGEEGSDGQDFHFAGDSSNEASNSDSTQGNASPGSNGPSSTATASSFTPPPDTDTTLTLLVVRRNWYNREQHRFLRFEMDSLVRIGTDAPHTERARMMYSAIVSARVQGSNIHFTVADGHSESYDFGDPQMARYLAEALSFLKKGPVAVSFVGN